jgi:hypothetical protein
MPELTPLVRHQRCDGADYATPLRFWVVQRGTSQLDAKAKFPISE